MESALALRPMSGHAIRRAAAALLAAITMMALAPTAGSVSPAVSRGAQGFVSVIVQGVNGAPDARAAVEAIGGRVERNLKIIGGVSAIVPESGLRKLVSNPRVWQFTPNDKIDFEGQNGARGPAAWDPKRIQRIVRSDRLWAEGITGNGVSVALLDTGVYDHPDLAGRVVCGVDLTKEANGPAACQDTFGHGTFIAGLIAGNGAYSNGRYRGTAPQSRIVSVKAAPFDGSTDVSTILAGIQWVVAHRSEYGIRVLNLSLGSDSTQDYRLSPLNYAVEKAWNEGIVVVVSAGNSGPNLQTVLKPGDDPYVVTVGSSNDEDTYPVGDDRVPVFSSRGPTRTNGLAKPDLVSPGVHTTSLRSPGSAIDQKFGATAAVDGMYFKGTGTSMSTGSVSGIVAQMLQRHPGLTPNEVKYRLLETARTIADIDPNSVGQGIVDAYGATNNSLTGVANQGLEPSSGLGSLGLDRGSIDLEVVAPTGQIALTGDFKAQTNPAQISLSNPAGLLPWVALDYTSTGWDATTWKATTWKTDAWAATTWKATTWKDTSWDATTWKGTLWENADWDATTWKTMDWDATTWKATTWKSHWYAVAWD
jgi:serine protease AprX